MVKVFLFIFRYKIKKNKENLGLYCKEFFSLSKGCQKKVLDIYFKKFSFDLDIASCFDNKKARYFDDGREVTFFDSYYFCKKIIDLNINNLALVDKFGISSSKKEFLIDYALDIINESKLKLNIDDILVYPNNLPKELSKNIKFMTYLTNINIFNIKYITYNENCPEAQRELIKEVIFKSRKRNFDMSNFLLNNKELPRILSINIDFIIYIIENDIDNIKYLNEKVFNSHTVNDKKRIIKAIIKYMNAHVIDVRDIFSNYNLANYLSCDVEFINYIVNVDVDNIKYVNFHNMIDSDVKRIIDALALKLVKENIDFDYNKYPFKDILKQNYMFMAYLIDKDKSNIKQIEISNRDEVTKLVDIYLNKYRKCQFDIKNYLDDNGYINSILVSNKHMLSYLIRNDNKIFRYIDFLMLNNCKNVVDVILKEMEKKDFEFDNDCFLRNGKYPVVLSNSYRFMRYVIDKNFNNLSYIDISMIDDRELKRIINYAFRMVYYIRGDNKNLNFDIDGYFKDSDIINNDYFQECLRCL